MDRVVHRAAVQTRVEVPLPRYDLDGELHDAARSDRHGRRLGVDHQRIEDDRTIRRSAILEDPVSNMVAARLFLTLGQNADVHRQLAGPRHVTRCV
jgi:hypothetical protein